MSIRPEFLFPNHICPKLNTDSSVTLAPTLKWHQNDKRFLYDHYGGYNINTHLRGVLYSKGADDDTVELTIEVDLGNETNINVIKMMNTNIAEVTVEHKLDSTAYATLFTGTNEDNVISWYNMEEDYPYYFTVNGGEYFLLDDGTYLALNSTVLVRYLKFTFKETVVANLEKYLGELYIGGLYLRPDSLILMSDSFTDERASDLTLWNNKATKRVNNATLTQSLSFNRGIKMEFEAIKNMISFGYLMEYIPNPSGLTSFTHNFDKKDIYLVQARNEAFSYTSFGREANGQFNMSLREAAIVTRRV